MARTSKKQSPVTNEQIVSITRDTAPVETSVPVTNEQLASIKRDTAPTDANGSPRTDAHIVIFKSGEGYFGIDIGIVQEIVLMQEITPIPGSASYIAGMTDLRGRVIPVAAFTTLLGIPTTEFNDDTRILVVENGAGHTGFIVDAVTEVMMVGEARIEDASSLGSREHDFIVGIAKLEEHLVSLVDVTRLLASADRDSTETVAA